MSLVLTCIILIGLLLLLLASGMEIAVAMGLVSSLGLYVFVGHNAIEQVAFTAFNTMNSFTLTAIPLFVFMGVIFYRSGVTDKLFNSADIMLRGLPGSLACSVMLANGIFGAMSGSSLAASATIGKIFYPNMIKLGYSSKLTLGSIAVGGTLSVLLPPSVLLIVYGSWQNISVARLFAAGLVPGIILVLFLIITVISLVLINPGIAPKQSKPKFKEVINAIIQIVPFLTVIIILLGMIFKGIMTPTESGALGVLISIIFSLIYGKIDYSVIKDAMLTAVRVTSMIAFLMFTAKSLGQIFHYMGITELIKTFILSLPLGKYSILIIIFVMYFILGMFFDGITMLVLTFPFVAPIIQNLGFDPIWFGVAYVILAELSLVTPPFGLNLFVLHSVVPQEDLMKIAIGVLPFIFPILALLLLITIFPEIVIWLPNTLY